MKHRNAPVNLSTLVNFFNNEILNLTYGLIILELHYTFKVPVIDYPRA